MACTLYGQNDNFDFETSHVLPALICAVAIVSYDEKPGMQAIGATAPDLPPKPDVHAAFARDHEYKRHGTLSRLAGIEMSMHLSEIAIARASSWNF
jgi:hypothetical protein